MDNLIDSTTNENDYRLFSVSQAARACSLSRSSLIRMEEKGLLAPAYIDADNGYRYYDTYNISRILQIQKFQRMGFGAEEILSYYKGNGKAEALLTILEQRLSVLEQQIAEMRMLSLDVPDMSLSIIRVPETLCCVRRYQGAQVQDYLEGNITAASYDFAICIPVLPKKAPEDAVSIPACTALSLLVYGDYGKLNEAYLYLGEQVRSRGLTPAGYLRTISLVGPYVGKEIDPGRYCSRLVLPIEGVDSSFIFQSYNGFGGRLS